MTALTTAESRQLASHETTIERGLKSFREVGNALMAIRDGHLYRQTHKTFQDYCKDRWGLERRRAYQLIDAATVVENVNRGTHGETPLPPNERQARELGRLPEDQRAETWREVVEQTDGKPTARDVHEAVEERIAKVIDVSPEFLPLDDSDPPVIGSPNMACPTCGSTERDADGDCARCHEQFGEVEGEAEYEGDEPQDSMYTDLRAAVDSVRANYREVSALVFAAVLQGIADAIREEG